MNTVLNILQAFQYIGRRLLIAQWVSRIGLEALRERMRILARRTFGE